MTIYASPYKLLILMVFLLASIFPSALNAQAVKHADILEGSKNFVIEGTLSEEDELDRNGVSRDHFLFWGNAGTEVNFRLVSKGFLPVLSFGHTGQHQGTKWNLNRQSSQELNLSDTLSVEGKYVLGIRSKGPGQEGAYRIEVETKPLVTSAVSRSGDDSRWKELYPGGGSPEGRYALLVGIEDYPGSESDLPNGREDTRIIQDMLVSEFGFDSANIVVLNDREATRSHIIHAMIRHLGQAGPEGVALFYFSGHGIKLERNFGWLPPHDNEKDFRDEALYTWGTRDASSILLDDELGYLIAELDAGRILAILDACFSGTGTRVVNDQGLVKEVDIIDVEGSLATPSFFLVAGNKEEDEVIARGINGTFSELDYQSKNHILLAASRENEEALANRSAYSENEGPASVFTHFLVKYLSKHEKKDTFDTLMNRVSNATVDYTRSVFDRTQTPQLGGEGGEVSIEMFFRALP